MESLLYTVIKNAPQYYQYCEQLEALVNSNRKTKATRDQIELLTLLIEKYDAEHNSFSDANPVELLKALLKEHKMKAVELATLLQVSEGLVSDILHYKKGFSKETIRILSAHFKLKQEAFNRPYALRVAGSTGTKNMQRRIRRKKPVKTS